MKITQLVVGEMIRRHTSPLEQLSIVVTLFVVVDVVRARGEPRYKMNVIFKDSVKYLEVDGYDVQDDDGNVIQVTLPEAYTFGGMNTCEFKIDAAYTVGAVYTQDRLAKQVAKVAALSPAAMRAKADAKELVVANWLQTERKVRALIVVQTLRDTATVVDLLRAP
jgi:hypothetical protein